MSEEINTAPAGAPAGGAAEPAAVNDTTQNANATPAPAETPAAPSAMQQMQEQYTLKDEEPAAEPQTEAPTEGGEQADETPFQLEFTEGTQIDEGLVGIATKHFKELGADGKAAGTCMERIVNEYQEQFYAQMAKNDAALKAEWGPEYNGRVTEVKQFLRAFCNKNGYPMDRVAAISSPDGYRLVWDIMERGGLVSNTPAGLGNSSRANDAAWFKKASTPGTPEFAALGDTTDMKKFAELNERYNRIQYERALSQL